MNDPINPSHYKRLPAEAIEIIESAIDNAPSNQDAYLHGQTLKYVLRCWSKNGIEDLKKAKWYLDRLVDSLDEYEKQKAADLQSLKEHPFGKRKWKPKIGEWVRINKPESNPAWMPGMDKYDGQIVEVKEIDDDPSTHEDWAYIGKAIVHDEWCFMFDWLEPAEAPKATDEVTGEVTEEVTGEVTVEVKPPDGWRLLEVEEMIRKGDKFLCDGQWRYYELSVGKYVSDVKRHSIRRNRFEVGEKVVRVPNGVVYKVFRVLSMGYQLEAEFCAEVILHGKDLAPYIEDTK